MLDRHADVVNASSRENLGAWIRGRLKHGVEARERSSTQELLKVGISVNELRTQWSEQRKAQLSVRNRTCPYSANVSHRLGTNHCTTPDAPARIKRDLDAVLNLQTELDAIDQYFAQVDKAISEDSKNSEVYHFLNSLRRTHSHTMKKVEELYSSLNVANAFPEIKGLPLEFVRALLMACDLKINICKRAIGTFFEWDKLDRCHAPKRIGTWTGLLPKHTCKTHQRRSPKSDVQY